MILSVDDSLDNGSDIVKSAFDVGRYGPAASYSGLYPSNPTAVDGCVYFVLSSDAKSLEVYDFKTKTLLDSISGGGSTFQSNFSVIRDLVVGNSYVAVYYTGTKSVRLYLYTQSTQTLSLRHTILTVSTWTNSTYCRQPIMYLNNAQTDLYVAVGIYTTAGTPPGAYRLTLWKMNIATNATASEALSASPIGFTTLIPRQIFEDTSRMYVGYTLGGAEQARYYALDLSSAAAGVAYSGSLLHTTAATAAQCYADGDGVVDEVNGVTWTTNLSLYQFMLTSEVAPPYYFGYNAGSTKLIKKLNADSSVTSITYPVALWTQPASVMNSGIRRLPEHWYLYDGKLYYFGFKRVDIG